MHSSRMHTARSSSHPGGVSTRHPSPWEQEPPKEQEPPRSRDQPPRDQPPWDQTAPRTRHSPRTRHPPGPGTPQDQAPPCGQTYACKHITLPQTSFAGGKNIPNDITSVFSSEIKNFIKATLVPNSQDDTNTDNVSSLNYRPQTKFGAR